MLPQYYLDKLRSRKLEIFEKLYPNAPPPSILQRSKTIYDGYKSFFQNNSHIHIKASGALSSYNFTSPMKRPKIPK